MFGNIYNKQREKLDYAYHEGNAGAKQIVVLGHGVTGNKDRPFVVALAEGLERAGVNVLRMSRPGFRGNLHRIGANRSDEIQIDGLDMTSLCAGFFVVYLDF